MVAVERAKWMTSAWDCTLGYGCVHWTSRPTMDCSGVHLFTVELLWTEVVQGASLENSSDVGDHVIQEIYVKIVNVLCMPSALFYSNSYVQ